MADDLARNVLQHVETLENERKGAWDSLWQELARVITPDDANVTTETTTPDETDIEEQVDGTAMRACQTLTNGQIARVTPMGARWFILRPPDHLADNPHAAAWYHRCSEQVSRSLAQSNFYLEAQSHYNNRGAFGTGATEVTAGPRGRGLHFREHPIGTYVIEESHRGYVDVFGRRYKLTARQALQMFKEACPQKVRDAAADPGKAHQPYEFIHYISPREERNPRKIDSRNKPWASIHVFIEDQATVAHTGYDEMPVAVSRWQRWNIRQTSPWGKGPGRFALPEAGQANYIENNLDAVMDAMLNPRILYTAGLEGDLDLRPGGMTCWNPAAAGGADGRPQEWLTGARYDVGKDRLADKRKSIEDAFFVPLFNAVSQLSEDATATQVRAIITESRELFHPIFAGLTREFLTPVLRRSFGLLLRQGELPPPPRVVYEADSLGAFIADPEVEYVSSMALALEQSHIINFQDILEVAAPLVAVDPGALDFINADVALPALMRLRGLPEDFIRPPEEVAAIREGRAQAAQAEQLKGAAESIGAIGGPGAIRSLSNELDGMGLGLATPDNQATAF